MKYIKHYNESLNNTTIDDIREFFSNLKKFSYDFKDYYNIIELTHKIEKEIDNNSDMTFFGYTNSSVFIPIVSTVTTHLHKMFDMIVANDYQGIYDYCNSKDSFFNYFIEMHENGRYYSKLKNHISTVLSKSLNNNNFKPYYELCIRKDAYKNNKYSLSEQYDIIKDILNKSSLNDEYDLDYYMSNRIYIKIIKKDNVILNSKQLKEIEIAKNFGLEKYNELYELLLKQEENNETVDMAKKFNV